jgi:hypothetical protein
MKRIAAFLLFAVLGTVILKAQQIEELIEKTLTAMGNTKNISYHFLAQERFQGGKMIQIDVKIKVQASPLKVFADATKPQTAKLSYVPAVSTKVAVRKGIKLHLDPHSSLLMKEQHHPLYKAGFGSVKAILETNIKMREGEDLSKYVKILGTVTYDGKECWKVELNVPDYKIINHTVKADEKTVWVLGKKLALPEYRIKELNDIGDELKPGQVIKIPNAYAKKTTLFIDKATYLPIYQKMEDDLGVYEIYEFRDLKLNVKFTDADFEV